MDELLDQAIIQIESLEDLQALIDDSNSELYDNSILLTGINQTLIDQHTEEALQMSGLFETFLGGDSTLAQLLGELADVPTTTTPIEPVISEPIPFWVTAAQTGAGKLGPITWNSEYPEWVEKAGVQNAYDYANRGSIGIDDFFMHGNELTTLSEVMSEYNGYANGGISTGPASGHMELLHGTEAIIPLNNGYIPVQIQGNNAELIAEIKQLRKELLSANIEIIKTNKKIHKILNRVNQGGTTLRTMEIAA